MTKEFYADHQGNTFKIEGVGVNINADKDNHWIFYTNVQTGEEYSCLSGAFFERFKKRVQ